MKLPMGRFGSLRPARERRIAFATAVKRLVLPDNALAQPLLHLRQLLHLAFEHLRNRNAGPLGDDLRDVFLVDLFLQQAAAGLAPCQPGCFGRRDSRRPASVVSCVQLAAPPAGISPYCSSAARCRSPLRVAFLHVEAQLLQLLFERGDLADRAAFLLPARTQAGSLLLHFGQLALHGLQPLLRVRIVLALQRRLLDLERRGPALQVVDLHRHAADLDRQRRRGFVDQVNGLVRQEAVARCSGARAPPRPRSPSP